MKMASISHNNTTEVINETLFDIQLDEQYLLGQYNNMSSYYETVKHFTLGICCVGLIGNILSLSVLLRRDMKSTTYTFFTGLAFADIFVLIAGTLKMCMRTMLDWHTEVLDDSLLAPVIYPVLRPIGFTCLLSSIWITVALTADRYIAVCHGFRKKPCSIPTARKIIVAIFIISTLFNIPTVFEYKVEPVYITSMNRTVTIVSLTDYGKNEIYKQIYSSWIFLPFLWGIPLLSLGFMNCRLILAVRRTYINGKALGQKVPKGTEVTLMLIAIIIVFLICQSPYVAVVMITVAKKDAYKSVPFLRFAAVTGCLVMLNSSINFIVYTGFGKRFRRKFVQTLCRCFLTKEQLMASAAEPSSYPESIALKAKVNSKELLADSPKKLKSNTPLLAWFKTKKTSK